MQIYRREFLRWSAGALAAPFIGGCSDTERVPNGNVPRSPFDEDSTAAAVTEGIDLRGKIAVVTGCNSGIGFETMRVLALRGAHVVGTGRTLEKAQAATARVHGITGAVQLELSDFDSVVACAMQIRAMRLPIDILVCNAGMRGSDREVVHGVEKHFAVNHLGHFILANRLLDRMYFAQQGRVVVVSSRAGYRSAPEDGIQFADLAARRGYDAGRAYAHSKLANALFSLHLAHLLKGSRITSNALHPGVIDTNIARNVNPVLRAGFSLLTSVRGKSVEQGAATSCFVATNPSLGNISGEYFEDCSAVTIIGESHMHDTEQAARLWQVSEDLTRDFIVEHGTPDPSELIQSYRQPPHPATEEH
jgi:NAD(P)-dependent dehydrogenase (short-subunit alcohol dehydrogenase family)